MKTTFKTVFNEMDDELMNLDMQENAPVDIDIDKIKSEVLMQINTEKNTKKKYNKKFIAILVAAVILVVGTVGAFATGSVQQIFGSIFHNGNQMNELGLFDGGNVERIVPALEALAKKCRHLVMVTNDVFSDGVTYAESTQEYLRQLAAVNAQAAKLADCVVEVVYSIPVCVKGERPCV